MKSTELRFIKQDREIEFEINSEINFKGERLNSLTKNFIVSTKIEIINEFPLQSIAGVREGYQYLIQSMLGNIHLDDLSVLVKEGTKYFMVVSRRDHGMIYVSDFLYKDYYVLPDEVLVWTRSLIKLPDMVILRPTKLIKEFLPDGGIFYGKHYATDNEGFIWEAFGDFWIKNPKVEKSIERFFAPTFGGWIMSQVVINKQLVSLLESGMILINNEIQEKNCISENEYELLIELAKLQLSFWTSAGKNDVIYGKQVDIHKDLTPCLFSVPSRH